jgi:hypothetical protein
MKGVDVVGGIPHFERTMEDGATSVVDRVFKLASTEFNLTVPI